VQHFIGTYGYFAIFILMVAESACIPIPSELTMPLGGAMAAGAAEGVHLSLALVTAVGVAGNLVGSYIAWTVGRYGGQGAWRGLTRFAAGSNGTARAQRWFDKYGARSVFIGRLLPVVRTFISLPAGFARIAPVRFGLYTVAGCIPWITALTVAGYVAGVNWHRVTGLVQQASYVVGAVTVLLVVAVVIFMIRARRRRRAGPPGVAPVAAVNDHTNSHRTARAAVSDGPRYRSDGPRYRKAD
jgi:membrane protein DedA with SNARE-associated domain